MFHISRRKLLKVLGIAPSALALSNAWIKPAVATAGKKTVSAVMHSDLRIIDPLFTTAYITRDHGYMVYDTLLATDSNFKVQPQMADWKVSDDKLTYTFTLRDGLKWHDGPSVTAEDCVASLKRWGKNDNMGQKLMDFTASIDAPDAKTIVLKLKEPYGLVLESIAKPSSYVPFMMPKRLAETPAGQQMAEQIGSGPFKFVKAEFQPGVKAVYEKNTDYVPRKEPPSWTAGGKVVNVDRVEWVTMPDELTATNALLNGEIDYIENMPYDLLPMIEGKGGFKVEVLDKLGLWSYYRFNFLHPPFNNKLIRRAAMVAVGQDDLLKALTGNPKYYRTCVAIFGCDTVYASSYGSDILIKPDPEKAKALLKEANYDGTPVVILHPTDNKTVSPQPVVIANALRKAGFTVNLQSMDWQTLTTRRASKK